MCSFLVSKRSPVSRMSPIFKENGASNVKPYVLRDKLGLFYRNAASHLRLSYLLTKISTKNEIKMNNYSWCP